MARPKKHNAEYFSHDNSMRNDLKIKALRRKYSHKGYSIFNMMLELLTENDYFEIEWSEINIELLTPDFDIDADELKEVINYCIKLDLLQLTNGYLHCNKLTERLEDDVLSRRKGYCGNNAKRMKLMLQQPNINEVNVYNNDVNDNINGQSKVKESKVNKIEIKESKVNKNIVNKLLDELVIVDNQSDIENVINDLDSIGWDNIYSAFNMDEREKQNYKSLVIQKLNSITE
jgi:hypothetical protein